MSPTSTDRITLTDPQRRELTRMTRAGRTEQRLATAGHDRAAGRRRDSPTHGSRRRWSVRGHRPQVAAPLVRGTGGGVAGRCETVRAPPDVHPVQVAQVKAVACAPPAGQPGYRCRGGRARNWPGSRHRAGSASRSRRRRCAGGCPRTRSNPGSTGPGSSSPIPTSPPRHSGYSTSTTESGRETAGRQTSM